MKRAREQVVRDFVHEWMQKAEADLKAAEHLLQLEQEDYFTVAFHAQQAAEKFLKALLVRHQIPFPKTHDIQRLLELLDSIDATIKRELASAAILTDFGVEFRYPAEEVADLTTARRAITEAKRVREAVLGRLRAYLSRGGLAK